MTDWRAVAKETLRIFSRQNAPMLAAATAFFALVSVAPLLLIALVVASALVDAQHAQREVFHGLSLWVGRDGAAALRAMLASIRGSAAGAEVTAVSVLVMAWASSRLFSHLQYALDHLWGVRVRERSALRDKALHVVRRRLIAFAMVLLCGAILISSLAFRTVIVAAERLVGVHAYRGWRVIDHALTLGSVLSLFTVIFRVLPHVRITWREALVGSAVTTSLFALGRFAVSAYLERRALGSAYGAAGSVVLLLLWTYYSAQIFFLGAAFMAARAKTAGRTLRPSVDAVALTELSVEAAAPQRDRDVDGPA